MKKSTQAGITLIELLVVVAIIGIFAAIAIPQVATYRAKGFDRLTESTCRNAAKAEELFTVTNGRYTIDPYELALQFDNYDVEVSILPGHTGDIKSSFEITCRSPKGTHGFSCIWSSVPLPGTNYNMHCKIDPA